MPKKPSCSDFIVATIRTTRPERKSLKPGTVAGKALRFIYSVAKQFYSEDVFRRSLNHLLANDVVLMVADVGEDSKEHEDRTYRLQKISRIPTTALLERSSWSLDERGKQHQHMMHIHLYIVTDGLPDKVAKTISGNGTTVAEEIMASLQTK